MSGTVNEVIAKHDDQCKRSVQHFKKELQKVRTGRASPGLLEGIMVEHYGTKMPLNQLAQISTPEARLILLQVYDAQAVSPIEKAIQGAGIGMNPSRDGNTIRLVVPPLTEETRKEIIKHLHKMAEEIRVAIRNHRRDANDVLKKFEKDNTFPKDEVKKGMEKVQKLTDSFITEVDKLLATKEAESKEM